MNKSMIFHHPLPVKPGGNSGSQVRPYQMAKAFEYIGYEVEMVTGYGADRKKAIKKIKNEANKGRKFDFIYSESSTMPTLLTEPHHLPIFPVLDFGFFKWAKNYSIPIGLFYRDIPWKFDFYKDYFPFWNRWFVTSQYWYDWFKYKELVDHLFLPSHGMMQYLPSNWDIDKVSYLPPGVSNGENYFKQKDINTSKINMLYVGGISPPRYDLRPLLKVVANSDFINLYLCCRENEWETNKHYYNIKLSNINIVHFSGDDLKKLYNETDIFALIWQTHSYLDFAMPVKVFESLGNGVPILTIKGTEAAQFILEEGIGWVIENIDEAGNLLTYLKNNPEQIAIKRKNTIQAIKKHTWEARASNVAETLINNNYSER